MKLKSVVFRDAVRSPNNETVSSARASERMTLELAGPLVRMTKVYGEPNVVICVPVGNVLYMEPAEDEKPKAGKP